MLGHDAVDALLIRELRMFQFEPFPRLALVCPAEQNAAIPRKVSS
jgi:hypothetical protein